jgi:hypothetical protein
METPLGHPIPPTLFTGKSGTLQYYNVKVLHKPSLETQNWLRVIPLSIMMEKGTTFRRYLQDDCDENLNKHIVFFH